MNIHDTLASTYLDSIRNREVSRGVTDRNDINSYTLGYMVGTLSTLMRKYPQIREDIQGYIDYIQNDMNQSQRHPQ